MPPSSQNSTSLRGGFAERPKHEDLFLSSSYVDQHTPRGLQNVGNTCYSNSVLQCLLSTALSDALLHPKAATIFRRYSSNSSLLVKDSESVDSDATSISGVLGADRCRRTARRREKKHKDKFDQNMQNTCEWLTKELTDITRDYVRISRSKPAPPPSLLASLLGGAPKGRGPKIVVNPGTITRHPERLSKCLHPYQQEDAHEFLRSLLSTLVMNGRNRKLSSLFDGLLESAVTCQTCQHSSLTRDRYMDLSLDIDGVKTLSEALDRFTATEMLHGENKVLCDGCGAKQTVTKQLRLGTAPSILVCHLKRFAMNQAGRTSRLNNHVRFPLRLEIGEHMSRVNKAKPPPYELVGVLVHKGRTCDSGHYLAYIKSGKEWFKANDSIVTPVNVDTVLSQQAYLLFYEVAEMRKKEGFTTPHAHRMPHPNLTRPMTTASDDISVPSYASTNVSEDDLDASFGESSFCSSWISVLQNTMGNDSLLFGDLCCQASEPYHRRETAAVEEESHKEEHLVVDDSTLASLGGSFDDSAGRMPRAGRMCKSNSSGDLTHFTDRAKSLPAVNPPRTLSFGRRLDPGGTEGRPLYRHRSQRRSSSVRQRTRESKLPPRQPLHATR